MFVITPRIFTRHYVSHQIGRYFLIKRSELYFTKLDTFYNCLIQKYPSIGFEKPRRVNSGGGNNKQVGTILYNNYNAKLLYTLVVNTNTSNVNFNPANSFSTTRSTRHIICQCQSSAIRA